eukprot:6411359-Prymnesium_polylepis.1
MLPVCCVRHGEPDARSGPEPLLSASLVIVHSRSAFDKSHGRWPGALIDRGRPAPYGGVPGDRDDFSRDHLLLQRGRMASAALSDY